MTPEKRKANRFPYLDASTLPKDSIPENPPRTSAPESSRDANASTPWPTRFSCDTSRGPKTKPWTHTCNAILSSIPKSKFRRRFSSNEKIASHHPLRRRRRRFADANRSSTWRVWFLWRPRFYGFYVVDEDAFVLDDDPPLLGVKTRQVSRVFFKNFLRSFSSEWA